MANTYLVEFIETKKMFVRVEADTPELAAGMVSVGDYENEEWESKQVTILKVEQD